MALLLEDSRYVSRVVERILRLVGFEVITVAQPEQALQILDGPQEISLLVLDYVLQSPLSGLDVAVRAQERRAQTPIVFLTGYREDFLSKQTVLGLAHIKLLMKPVRAPVLVAAIKALVPPASDALTQGAHVAVASSSYR
ncbi:response regulator [Candidatus Rhodobacter oscarellae]|uniref:response regulator n=1 Tax=Candidatus Rhodobacter oscarellae TaxID=1675527 RepID=UPI001F3D77D5|nr:response regulator [Candidatus Rhodobacter lobularis]